MVVPMQQVQTVETGQEAEIIIIRQGKPVARVTAVQDAKPSKRIGVARGRLKVPEDLDKYNDEIAELLGVTP